MEYRVWVVDDDPMSLRVVKRVFDKSGVSGEYFRAANDVLSRLDGASSDTPDLMMPFFGESHIGDGASYYLRHVPGGLRR